MKKLLTGILLVCAGCATMQRGMPLEELYTKVGHKTVSTTYSYTDSNQDGKPDFCEVTVESEYKGRRIITKARHGYKENGRIEEKPLWVEQETRPTSSE